MKENGTDEPDPTICIVPLYSAPKIPLVSHLLTIPAPKIVDIIGACLKMDVKPQHQVGDDDWGFDPRKPAKSRS